MPSSRPSCVASSAYNKVCVIYLTCHFQSSETVATMSATLADMLAGTYKNALAHLFSPYIQIVRGAVAYAGQNKGAVQWRLKTDDLESDVYTLDRDVAGVEPKWAKNIRYFKADDGEVMVMPNEALVGTWVHLCGYPGTSDARLTAFEAFCLPLMDELDTLGVDTHVTTDGDGSPLIEFVKASA